MITKILTEANVTNSILSFFITTAQWEETFGRRYRKANAMYTMRMSELGLMLLMFWPNNQLRKKNSLHLIQFQEVEVAER